MSPLFATVARATAGGLLLLAVIGTAVASAAPGDVGHKDHSFGTGSNAVTASKPESKLWYNDGIWWGSMRGPTGTFFIYRLNPATETWASTGVALDNRVSTRADTLWDGTNNKLYVASQNNSDGGTLTGGTARLYRFSYNSSTDTYTLDGGFPATMRANIRSETLVIAKDSTGLLWATWTENSGSNRLVKINHSTAGNDALWTTPVTLPVGGQPVGVTTDVDDISTIIAFKPTGQTARIGVLWSNQNDSRDYFAWRVDGTPDSTVWTAETAIAPTGGNPSPADDHLNIKTDANGRIYAVIKTSNDTTGQPQIQLLSRQPAGGWSVATVATGTPPTRPILELDETANMLHVYLTGPTTGGGTIYEKTSSTSPISFSIPGLGTPVIHDVASSDMNNATSTKQNINGTSGVVVLASSDGTDFYWHHHDLLGGTPNNPQAGFNANPTTGTTPLTVQFTNTSTGTPTPTYLWDFGDPASGGNNSSTLTNPSHTYNAAGTYSVKLTATNSNGSSVSNQVNLISVSAPTGIVTLEPVADAQVLADSPTTNYGSRVDFRTRDVTAPIYRSFLRFNVSGITGPITNIKLRLYATDASPDAQGVYPVADTTWIETGPNGGTAINWNNQPAMGLSTVGSAPTNTLNGYNEITLNNSAISGNGLVSFGLRSAGSNSAIFSSREAAAGFRPQLVITQTIGPANTPPTANSATGTVPEDGSGLVALSGSDPDVGNCELTFTLVTPPTKGTVNFAGQSVDACVSGSPNTDTTSVTYTPNANASGPDSFTYKVNDGTADSTPATASITITPSNDTPSAGAVSTTASIGTPKTITLTGADVETCELTFTVLTQPTHGTLAGGGTITPQACAGTGPFTDSATVSYTATDGTSDSFTYKVNDGTIDSASATVTITITAANTPPTANATSATIAEDGSGPVALSGGDAETCDLTFSIVSPPTHGTLGSISNNACAGTGPFTDSASVTYTPAGNYNGPDSFTYKVNDGSDDSAPATATLTVTSVNDTPTANPVTTSTPQNTPKVITLSGSDVDDCDLVFARTQGSHGSVSAVTDNACSGSGPFTDSVTVTYTPDTGYSGPDSFTYTVADATATSIPATVSITVNASGGTVTLNPVADAKVNSGATTTNYGTTTDLRTREENPVATTTYRSFLKFNVPGVTGTVSSIKLRLFVTSASVDATHVFAVTDTSWIESGVGGITWANAPAISATSLGSSVAGPAGAYIEITVNPSAIIADGVARTYSFAIKAAANHSGTYSSKESATNKPELRIVTGP